jgi:primosomal protein N' (replication factor Y)
MKKSPLFAEVIIPLPLKGTFTYSIPESDRSKVIPGIRVIVQLGQKKLYSAIVKEIHANPPENFEAKSILTVLDEEALVSDTQLQFWSWISTYYMCTPGEVMNAALPGGLKLASETLIHLNNDFMEFGRLDKQEDYLFEFIKEENISNLEEIRKSSFGNDGLRIAKKLIEKGALLTDQYLKEGFRPKKIVCLDLSPEFESEQSFANLMDRLSKASAQLKALEEYVQLSGRFDKKRSQSDIERKDLLIAGVAGHALNALLKKNVFIAYEITKSRIQLEHNDDEIAKAFSLTEQQNKALNEINKAFKTLPVVLLHGITSSGKTEVYIQMIKKQLELKKQVLYLLPEIALTTQIIRRLKSVFGEKIGVYHSRYSDNERVEVYRNLAGLTENEPYSIILGVRSAVFLPFHNLGLVIVDEEHEQSYKQFDPAPRYHARDAATILGLFTGAKILLGSATPSFESLYNTMTKKYGLVEIKQRYGKAELPQIIIANVAQAKKRKQLKSHFTPELLNALTETLAEGQQAILFQNRRGHSNYLLCEDCGFILKCKNCDVSMTYHKFNNEMICHYCGIKLAVPASCPDCRSHNYSLKGFGTEKIEDEIRTLFPDAGVGRLDLDKAKSRKAYEKLITDFEVGKTQILVGTQMVTKGLDFENVNLVGILDADSMLNFPDFRAFERSFQLMVQVSGRAGRRIKPGKVVIQTHDPSHPVIQRVLENKFSEFFSEQMAERKVYSYPPYVRLIRLTLKHEIPSILDGGSVFLANELRELFGSRVLGPQQPYVSRTHGKYIKQIILKIEKEASFEKAKGILGEVLEIFGQNPVYKQIRKIVEVDPL